MTCTLRPTGPEAGEAITALVRRDLKLHTSSASSKKRNHPTTEGTLNVAANLPFEDREPR